MMKTCRQMNLFNSGGPVPERVISIVEAVILSITIPSSDVHRAFP